MSHFTVLVIGDDVEGQLEPFDENTEVEGYREDVSQADVDNATQHYANNPKPGVNPGDPLTFWIDWSGRPIFKDEKGWYQMSTYNPFSKWDWYVIGGRWSGYFPLKEGATGFLGRPGVFNNQPEEGYVDQTLKGYIDLDRMRSEASQKASDLWIAVHKVIDPLPAAKPWKEFMAEAEAEVITWDQAREAYNAQERVKAMQSNREELGAGIFASPDDFAISHDVYVRTAEAQAVPGFAVLFEGQWLAAEDMGWWGMSSPNGEISKGGYLEIANSIIDKAADDVMFTIVDCHI